MELFIDFLLISGIILILVILFFLSRAKQRELPQHILIFIFIILFSVLLQGYGEIHRIKPLFLSGFFLSEPVGYILGPLLYLYVKSLYYKQKGLIKNNVKHFIPFFLYMMIIVIPLIISFIISKPLFKYIEFLQDNNIDEFEVFIQDGFLLLYLILALKLLNQFQKSVKANYCNLHSKDINWIKNLLSGLSIITALDILVLIYEITSTNTGLESGILIVLAILTLIIYLGYFGTTQSRILLLGFIVEEDQTIINKNEYPPGNHPLVNTDQQEIDALKTCLLQIMEIKKPYLNEDLNLGTLANLISTSDKKLSTLLNQYLDTSFYDFINNYRVEEVKTKMANPAFEKYTLMAIAYESGFNSKTSFNRIFKKSTGYSPSAYKKKFLV